MPIVETVNGDAPLGQGDILKGVTLFATKDGWIEYGGEAAKAPFKLCLVVSRPCAIAHKAHVTVAGVDRYPEAVPREINTFDRVLDFLKTARDGVTSPDVFYLGQLPGLSGRYCARLDSLHTVALPPDPASMAQFLIGRRVARIAHDFIRGLHTRLFNSLAVEGFDDQGWLSTEDLTWLVTTGRAEVDTARAAVGALEAKKASLSAEGKSFAEKELTNAQGALAGLEAVVRPYEAELAQRQADGASQSASGAETPG